MESIKEYFRENRCFYLALLLLLMGFIVWCYVSGRGTADINKRTDIYLVGAEDGIMETKLERKIMKKGIKNAKGYF